MLPAEACLNDAGSDPVAEFDRQARPALPALLLWAHLRIPESVRALLPPRDVSALLWTRWREQWSQEAAERTFGATFVGLGRTLLLELFRWVKMQALFTGGGSRPLHVLGEISIPPEAACVVREAGTQPATQALIARTATLPIEDQHLVLWRIEGVDPAEMAERLQLTAPELRARWRGIGRHLGRERLLLARVEVGPERSEPGALHVLGERDAS